MGDKTEEIRHIQYTLWEMYKNFDGSRHGLEEYLGRAYALVAGCSKELQCFSRNLVSVWLPVIEGMEGDSRDGKDARAKADGIRHIQNTTWAMYMDFLADHDLREYSRKMRGLAVEYYRRGDRQLLDFCQCLLISWVPVICAIANEYRRQGHPAGRDGEKGRGEGYGQYSNDEDHGV